MGAYEQFLKETKSGAPSVTGAKVVSPTLGGSEQPVKPATSAYERFQQETSGKQVTIPSAVKPTEEKQGFYSKIQEKGQRIGVSFDAGIVAGVGGILKGLQWVGDRLSGGDRIVTEASEKLLQAEMDAQTAVLKRINEKKEKGQDYKKELEALAKMKVGTDFQTVSDTTDTSFVGKAGNKLNTLSQKMKDIGGITPENQSFVEKVFEGAGSSVVYFVPAVGVFKGARVLSAVSPRLAMLFGGSASATLESMAEAGQVFEEVKKKDGLEKAKEASTKTFWANAILLALTENLGVFNPAIKGTLKKALISMPTEGFQESAQQLISNVESGRPTWEGVAESGVIGSIIGGVMGGTMDLVDQKGGEAIPVQLEDKTTEKAPEIKPKEPQSAYERFLAEGGQSTQTPAEEIQKALQARTEEVKITPKEDVSRETPEKMLEKKKPVGSLKVEIQKYKTPQEFVDSKNYLFHGTIEEIKGELRGGAFDKILWTAEDPAVAQNYIPESGGGVYHRWANTNYEKTKDILPVNSYSKALYKIAGKNVEDVKIDKFDERNNPVSWRGTALTQEEADQALKKLGYTTEDNLIKTKYIKDEETILPKNFKETGSTYVIKKGALKLYDMTNKEFDMQDPSYLQLETLNKIREQGYDGVIVQDVAQTKEGNIEHKSVGLFPSGIEKSKVIGKISTKNFDISQSRERVTDEFKNVFKKKEIKEKLPKSGMKGASIGRFREEGDITLGNFDQIQPIQFPELVALAKELSGSEVFAKKYKMANGMFYSKDARIGLNVDLFTKGNLGQLQKTMAHEIGHLIDYLPEGTLARGNLMARLAVLKDFSKDFYAPAGATRSDPELRAQMWELSKYWKPIDEKTASKNFLAYRKSAPEVYADFISVLFNNPKLAGEIAPTAYNIFFKMLDAKPDVKRAYFELQDLLRNGEKVLQARRDKVKNMFTIADQTAKDRQNQIELEEEAKKKSLWFRFKFQNVSRFEALRELVKEKEKKGEFVNPDDNPVYYLEESNYLGGQLKAIIDEKFNTIYQELQENDLTWDNLGEITFYERILKGDRGEVANPEGIQIDFIQELYEGIESVEGDTKLGQSGQVSMKSELGEVKFAKLQSLAVQYRAQIKGLYRQAFEAGMISKEAMKMIEASDFYVPFKPIKYAGTKTTYSIKNKKGTLQPIENPANTGIEKVVSLVRAMERNKVNEKTITFLQSNFPKEIQEAKYAFNGKTRIALEPIDKKLRLISYMKDGKMQAFYVDEYIGEAVKKSTVGQNNMILEGLRFLNSGLFRPLFITFNLGFQSFNFIRDLTRFWKNIPQMTFLKAIRLYSKSARGAKIRAFGLPKNPSKMDQEAYDMINKLESERILAITYNDIIKGEDVEDRQIDRILREVGVREAKSTKLGVLASKIGLTKNTPIIKQALGIMEFIEKTGNLIETIPKIAGYYALEGKMPAREMRSFIRRKVGSPDFLDGGKFKPVINEVFLFSNAIFQGVRADYEVATQPKTRSGYWWKTTQATFLPKILMMMATAGLFGEWLKDIFAKMSEYDKTNYLTVPLGKDENGKAIYFRIPQDETSRMLGGLLWKIGGAVQDPKKLADMETYTNILAYAGGQAPSVSPSITSIFNTTAFISGQNPYDFFRGRPVLTDDQMLAGGVEKVKPFLAYMFESMGGSLFAKLYYNETVPKDPSLSERVVNLPMVSNVAGRFIKVSNYGETEKIREITGEIRAEDARENIKNRRVIFEYVQKAQDKPYGEVQAIKKEMLRTMFGGELPKTKEDRLKARTYEKRFDTLKIRGNADARVDALVTAQSNEEKVALLTEYSQTMEKAEFEELKKFIIKNRIVSGDAFQQFIRQKNATK